MPGGDPPTSTAAGGMHPTGMHSCLLYLRLFSTSTKMYTLKKIIFKVFVSKHLFRKSILIYFELLGKFFNTNVVIVLYCSFLFALLP